MIYFAATMFYSYAFMQEDNLAAQWLAEMKAKIDGANGVATSLRNGAQRLRSITRAIG